MPHSLVCFYDEKRFEEKSLDPIHRVLIKTVGHDVLPVEQTSLVKYHAKEYLLAKGVPSKDLVSSTVENYGEGLIKGVDLIFMSP